MQSKIVIILFFIFLIRQNSIADSLTSNHPFKKDILYLLPEFKHIELNTCRATFSSSSFGGDYENVNYREALHNDSIHKLNFQYKDKRRGIKPFIAPAILITTGTILNYSSESKENFQDWILERVDYSGHVEDYLQYAPLAVVYGLNAFGVKGKNNFGNRTAIVIKSLLLNDLIVSSLKTWTHEARPEGGSRSFPSGHTSVSFAMAQIMHHEFGDRSVWFSIGAYTCATTVGLLRVAGNAHWISDVVAGAGFGMLSTELVYLTHLYKWDNKHIKKLDIFPFKVGKQSGVALVYTF